MNLKILPRSLEEIILSHILPIEYQKRHKEKMEKLLLQIETTTRSKYNMEFDDILYCKTFWTDECKRCYILKPNSKVFYKNTEDASNDMLAINTLKQIISHLDENFSNFPIMEAISRNALALGL